MLTAPPPGQQLPATGGPMQRPVVGYQPGPNGEMLPVYGG